MNSCEGGNSFPEAINEQKSDGFKDQEGGGQMNCSQFCGKLPLGWEAPAAPPSPWMVEKGEGARELGGCSFSKVSALKG